MYTDEEVRINNECYQQALDNQTLLLIQKDDEIARLKSLLKNEVAFQYLTDALNENYSMPQAGVIAKQKWEQFKTENKL